MDKFKRGQSPYGFYWQSGQLLVEQTEATIRQKAAELFLKSKSMGAVARELNALGHLTRRSGKWSDVQVARILECPSGVGQYEIKRTEEVSGQRRKTAKGERLAVECEPIFTRETWEKLVTLIKENREKRSSFEQDKALLTGLVFCSCGQRMKKTSDSPRFRCSKCPTLIAETDLEEIFSEDFGELLSTHPDLAGALEVAPERRKRLAEITRLETELEESAKRRDGVERMYTEASISKARFEELHVPLESRVRELEGKIAVLRQELAEEPAPLAKPKQVNWSTLWPSWPEVKRRQIITTFVSSFVVGEDEVEIAYLLPEPPGSKDTAQPQQTTPPTNHPKTGGEPVYIRLPKPGEKCPITGLSRAKLNELILPNERNHFKPPVASKSLRKKGAQRGVRLVLLESLMAHLLTSDP